MSMTNIANQEQPIEQEKPGAYLAANRALRDFTPDYVAGKLHLRVKIIELLEADEYEKMPEPVFIRGYLRAYAKLLGVPADPVLKMFNALYADESKPDRTLWQSRRQNNRAEYVIRSVTIVLSLGILVAVGLWWESGRDNEQILPVALEQQSSTEPNHFKSKIPLTNLSKMRSLLYPSTTEESAGGDQQ